MTGEKRKMTGGSDDSKGARALSPPAVEAEKTDFATTKPSAGASGVKVAQVISSRLK